MAYRHFSRRTFRATPKDMTIKRAGPCACCGVTIPAGAWATYFPPGTLASRPQGAIAHVGGLDGNSATCAANIRDRVLNDFAGEGVDMRYEDDCAAICGD